jgi:hypothetical protein
LAFCETVRGGSIRTCTPASGNLSRKGAIKDFSFLVRENHIVI